VRVHDDDGCGAGVGVRGGGGGRLLYPKYSDQQNTLWRKNAQQVQSPSVYNIDRLRYVPVCVCVCVRVRVCRTQVLSACS